MSAGPGNQSARKGKIWRDAIHRALRQFEDKKLKVKRGQAIDRMAWQLVRAGIQGDEFAIREIGNRTDGKPVQATEVTVDINARSVILNYVARFGPEGTREVLQRVAPHLIPMMEMMRPDLAELPPPEEVGKEED